MKQTKKLLSLFLVLTLAVVGCLSIDGALGTEKVKAASYGDGARNAYKSYMGRNKYIKVSYIDGYDFENAQMGKFQTKIKKINLKNYIHYAFVDINNDGVPELFVSNKNRSKGFGKVLICTYSKGKVVPMLCVNGIRTGIYSAKNKQVCFGFGASNEKTYTFAKISKNKIKHVATYRKESTNVKGGKKHNSYYKNAKKCKKNAYMNNKKKIVSKIDV